ncbi:MAG: hypothetical protein R6W83_03120 [Cryobacterium sp.]
MTSRWARVGRGSLTAAVAVVLAALSHVAAGGPAPGALGIIVALGLAVPISVLLAGKTLSLFRLSLAVGLSQLLLHGLFGMGTGGAAVLSVAGHHGAVTILADSTVTQSLSHGDSHTGGAMWLAHGFAAVITIVALRRGERAACALLQLARTQLRAVLIALGSTVPVLIRPITVTTALLGAFVPTPCAVLLSPMRHRGPPQLQTAF